MRVSTCGMFDRFLLLEDAGLHAVIADAVAGAGAHRVVERDEGHRREDVALLPHGVHLAYLLVQRAAGERDAERVLLQCRVGEMLAALAGGASALAAPLAGLSCMPLEHESLSRSWQKRQ